MRRPKKVIPILSAPREIENCHAYRYGYQYRKLVGIDQGNALILV
jgi:hypothetical protein